MSEVTTEVEPRLQYILNDPRFILDSSELDTEGMSDIIYTDDNQAIILNGEIIEDDNTSTFILQNDGSDLSHYITNNDTEGEILIANLDPSNIDQYQDSQHIIQYVDEDGNVTNAADVVYVNEDGIPLNAEDISSHYQMELMEIGQSTCDEEQIKDDRIINFECVSDKKGDHSYGGSSDEGEINAARIIKFECVPGEQEDNTFIAISPADWYQYTQAKDGLEVDDSPLNEYQYTAVQNNTFFTVPSLNSNENANTKNKFAYQLRDVPTAITGKNLITGQIVTLDSYMDKIKDRIKSNRSNSVNGKCRLKHNLNAFLNKKFNLGLTVGGKNLIAKIIHVSSKQAFNKNQEQSNEICGPVKNIDDAKSETEDRGSDILNKSKQSANTPKKPVDPKLMCVQTKLLSKKSDQFQRISKILSDLMKTEKVKNQLLNKSIHIDIVDKYCYNIKNMVENVSFISGYMEKKVISTKNELVMEEWVFVPDTLKTHNAKTNSKKQSEIKYPNIIGVTVVTTHKRDKDYVKILLDSSISIDNLQCRHCGQLFQTINNMRVHINSEHIICEICDTMFETREALLRHKRLHPKNSKEEHLKHCNVDHCGKYFLSDSSYQQHLLYHKLNPNSVPTFSDLKACEICDNLFIDEDELADHKKTHIDNISFDKEAQTKYYACEICKRTFSRMANLQRHVGIHKEGDQLFRCAVCRCSFQYISSLTRHILQNHVQLQRPNFV